MAAPISSLSSDIWPLICEYLTASDICELQCSGYRPFLKFLSYSSLHDLNLLYTHYRPFLWPPWLSSTSFIRSISIIGYPTMAQDDWEAFDIYQLPKTLTSLKLCIARTFSPFYTTSGDVTDAPRLHIDEMFPCLLTLYLEEPYYANPISEFVLPRNLTSFHSARTFSHQSPSWPENLKHLNISSSKALESWVPNLPITLQTFICGPAEDSLLPLLTARLPGLKTLKRQTNFNPRDLTNDMTLGSMLPRGLTTLSWPTFSTNYSVQIRPYVSDLPPQLTKLDIGRWRHLEDSDIILIPRTVTDWDFIIRTVSCLEASPPSLRSLRYYAQNNHECEIGAFFPKNLTLLNLAMTRLPDSEYHLLPASLTDLHLNCINNASAKHIGNLKYLKKLRIYGGKLSRVGFLRLPRSLSVLWLRRSFITGTDALHDSLPNLESFEYLADPTYMAVLEPGVFQKLPLSLTDLNLTLGPSHSRYLWTNELSRLPKLRVFHSLGAPYDSNLKGLIELPPSLTSLDCYPSWPFSSAEIRRLPKTLSTIYLKSTQCPKYASDDSKHLGPALTLWSSYVHLKSHHPLYGKKYDE